MSNSSDQSAGLFGGLIVGFGSFVAFGLASCIVLGLANLKNPEELTYEGDFTESRREMRALLKDIVISEQEASVDAAKLAKATLAVKATAPASSGIAVPGSPTALKASQPKAAPAGSKAADTPAPVVPEQKVSEPAVGKGSKPAVPNGASSGKGKAKSAPGKGGQKGKVVPNGKSKGKAAASEGASAQPKGKAKTSGPKGDAARPKGKGKGQAKGKAVTPAE